MLKVNSVLQFLSIYFLIVSPILSKLYLSMKWFSTRLYFSSLSWDKFGKQSYTFVHNVCQMM